jgi:type I restriction enzyme M protein
MGGVEIPIEIANFFISVRDKLADIVSTNPPLGKKNSVTITNGGAKECSRAETHNRQDLSASTSNKQPNFQQQVLTLRKIND